jgi:hypothetical protein
VCSLATVFALGAASASLAAVHNLGVLTPTTPLSQAVFAAPGAVDDQFTFDIPGAAGSQFVYTMLVNSYMQTSGGSNLTGLLGSGGANDFVQLFSGLPGSGTPVAGSLTPLVYNSSSNTVTGSTLAFTLTPGDYYVEVMSAAPAAGGSPNLVDGGANYTVGLFAAAVPEPATWAMLIFGVAMIGLAARRRSAGPALAA